MTTRARVAPPARIVVAAMIVVGVAAMAGRATNAGDVLAQEPDDDVRLELVDQEFSIEPDGTIHLEYVLRGLVDDPLELVPAPPEDTTTTTAPADPTDPDAPATTTSPPPPPPAPVQLTVEVTNYQPLTTPSDVSDVVGSAVDPDAFDDVSDVIDGVAIDLRPLATRADDGTVRFTLDVPTDVTSSSGPDSLRFPRPGLAPLRVQVVVGDDDREVVATAGTIVQRLPAPADAAPPPPIDLAVVVATPDPGPAAAPSATRAAADDLGRAVDVAAALDAPVTMEAPPDLVADAASTSAGATELADALTDAELVAMPLVPLDVSSAVAAGRAETYTRLVIAGADVLTDAVPTTPTRRDVWITRDALSAGGAQHLRDLGVRYVIVPEAVYRDTISADLPETDLFVEAALPDGGRLPLLIVDRVSDDLDPVAADGILADSTPTEWAVERTAEMLIEQTRDDATLASGAPSGATPERSRILSTPDLRAPDERLLDGLVRLAETTPSIRFTAASALTGVTDAQREENEPLVVMLPDSAGPSLAERVTLIDATALSLASAASMLPPDDPRPAEWTVELDSLISTGYTDDEVVSATEDLLAEADRLREAVVLPAPFTFTLTGRSGDIDFRLGNTSDEMLSVVVHLESTKVGFPSGDQTVELRPLDETTVTVPVEARSNGTSSIELSVFTPAGEPLDDPVTLTARVTGLTGLGQVLTGGFILVLLTWWFSHWRARRRAAQPDEDDDADDPDERQAADDEVESETL